MLTGAHLPEVPEIPVQGLSISMYGRREEFMKPHTHMKTSTLMYTQPLFLRRWSMAFSRFPEGCGTQNRLGTMLWGCSCPTPAQAESKGEQSLPIPPNSLLLQHPGEKMDVDGKRKEIASFNVTAEIFILAIFCFSGRAYSCLTAVG